MKELGIAMYFKNQEDNHWWDHIANDSIRHLQSASTLCLGKLNNSLAKEPISTHAKSATRMLDAKYNKAVLQLIVKDNQASKCQCQRSYCSFFIFYESIFDGTVGDWKTKPVSFQVKGEHLTMAKLSQCQKYTRYPHLKSWEVV